MRNIDKEEQNKRIFSFIVIISTIFTFLIIRLYFIQVYYGDEYFEKAEKNSLRTNILIPVRGKIYDKNGKLLVSNITGYHLIHKESINISKEELNLFKEINKNNDNIDNILDKINQKRKDKLKELYYDILELKKISKMNFDEIAEIFYKSIPYGFDKVLIILEDLNFETVSKEIEKLTNPRIDIVEYNKRYYHKNEIASHVIGNVKLINEKEYEVLKKEGYGKNDLIGKDGIEKTYDKILKGKSGKEFVEVDARGNILNKLEEVQAEAGKNIYLSIDLELQEYMNKTFFNKIGTFIAMDIKTGKILTYVSYPEIDLNLLSSKISISKWNELLNSPKKPLLNRGIAGLFPPGSTAKVVSGATFLEQGILASDTTYSSGEFKYGNISFRDSKRSGHGTTNFYKSISDSVNTYYYENILKINKEKYFELASNFGIGRLTEIDLPGEKKGVLPTPNWKKQRFSKNSDKIWLPGDLINMSIGQGYMLTTPLQVLMFYSAIANDGIMMRPTLVESFQNFDGTIELKNPEVLRKIELKKTTLIALKKALKETAKTGTARNLSDLEIEVSVKTGTAQNSKGADHSWMAGYFPANKPEIAFVALVENGGFGSVEAGLKVREFVTKYYELERERKQ